MSNEPKKRGGIGDFWDTVAPPSDEVRPPTPTTVPLATGATSGGEPAEAPRSSGRTRATAAPQVATARPRGRPPTGIVKERMTVNLDPRSLQILEALRYQARKQGQRNATFSDLLDEAVMLLAKQYKLKLDD